MMDFEKREFELGQTLHSKETEMIRIRMAQIIVDNLMKMENSKEPAAVISLVIADLVDREIAKNDELAARAIVGVIANAAMHVWGAANGIDIPLEPHPAFPDNSDQVRERLAEIEASEEQPHG